MKHSKTPRKIKEKFDHYYFCGRCQIKVNLNWKYCPSCNGELVSIIESALKQANDALVEALENLLSNFKKNNVIFGSDIELVAQAESALKQAKGK